MQRALQLAEKGGVFVAPNPKVGAVIVHNDKIIGEGFHKKYGEAHAEVNAVESVTNKDVLKEATIYVTLEPCSHFGKTPPCSDLIIKYQFKRVVVACIDTFSEVAGRGVERIRNAGIQVEVGVLEKEARFLNRRFFTYHEKNRPYIILKWAQTLDGFLDEERGEGETGIHWITQPETKCLVHKWRGEEQSILVGVNTINTDDPLLNLRNYLIGKSPIRFVLDPDNSIKKETKVLSDNQATIVFNQRKNHNLPAHTTQFSLLEFSLSNILKEIHKQGISSIFVEGGRYTHEHFLTANLWDETRVLVGTTKFQQGLKAPLFTKSPNEVRKFGKDEVRITYNEI